MTLAIRTGQHLRLPAYVVRVLQAEGWQERLATFSFRLVEQAEFVDEYCQGPKVRHDMVHRQQKHVLPWRPPVEIHPQQTVILQIERLVSSLNQAPVEVLFAPGGRIFHLKFDLDSFPYELDRLPPTGGKSRPKGGVTVDHHLKCTPKGIGVQFRNDPDGG